jgi:hypothetical protein
MLQKTTKTLYGNNHSNYVKFKTNSRDLQTPDPNLIRVGPMPKFKHHKIPNMGAEIAARLLIMSFEQSFKCRPLKIAPL